MADDMSLMETLTPGGLHGEVLEGLLAPRKTLPSKYLYDAEGSRLFEAICELPEYYVTRAETALLASMADQIAAHAKSRTALVEFGSGASTKTRLLLDAAPQIELYVPIDISPAALADATRSLTADYPRLKVAPLIDDFTRALRLPAAAHGRPVTGFFPGSTIGNLPPAEAIAFLRNARLLLGPGASFVIGADLAKSPRILVPAYDDAKGVTAAFNKNLLTRLNRELHGTFDLDAFDHRADWNALEGRMEMHLVSRRAQAVWVAGRTLRFSAGETIHTENSYKYTPGAVADLARRAGWDLADSWISPAPEFGIFRLSQ